ncbi:uncharacterized protein LOC111695842 isoform X2 [Eurytemora carolleeae]|nr:uncharacterized protein LOC111695842 isoform X2 [Eurytemora carolleeae]|eukprot:XP_023321066.1 uncharacterized protein LOC111695842 isoform X2 [Eurytemora affinis]
MWMKNCSPEYYMSTTYSNLDKILELCEVWNTIDLINTFNAQSFSVLTINKIGNSERNSNSRFRRFDKDTFVRFMKLVGNSQLGDGFHKYYCTIKFLDHLPNMNLKEITSVTQAFVKQKFFGTRDHPVEIKLRRDLIRVLLDNLENLESDTLSIVSAFISPVGSRHLVEDCLLLQDSIYESGSMSRLEISSLINLATTSSRVGVHAVHKPFLDEIVQYLCSVTDKKLLSIPFPVISELALTLGLQRDTPKGRYILTRIRDLIIEQKPENLQKKEAVVFLLSLSFLQLYSSRACDLLFSSPQLTVEKDGLRSMHRGIRFRKKIGALNLGGNLLSLQGMMELEYPEYPGSKITAELDETVKCWLPLPLPTEATLETLDKKYVKNGIKIFTAIEDFVGKGKVSETCVFPFFGCISYVIYLNQAGEPQPVPSQLMQQPICQTKRVSCDTGTWLMITALNGERDTGLGVRTGGFPVLLRVGRKLGFTPVLLDGFKIEDLDEEKFSIYIKNLLEQNSNIKCRRNFK